MHCDKCHGSMPEPQKCAYCVGHFCLTCIGSHQHSCMIHHDHIPLVDRPAHQFIEGSHGFSEI